MWSIDCRQDGNLANLHSGWGLRRINFFHIEQWVLYLLRIADNIQSS